jgi:hypothetical protein
MCAGIALSLSELPLWLHERVHIRDGQREARFLWRHHPRLLPVWHEGRLQIVRWGGSRRGSLPVTGWAWRETLDAGGWAPWQPELVDIPATFCLEGGVWFRVRQGVRGLLVHDDQDEPAAYILCEPATRYYRVMTRSDRMPVFIGERL